MHTTTKLGTIVVISLLLGGCSFFGGDDSDAAASVSASAAASPVFQAKEVSPITAAELDKPQTDPGLNVEITLQAAGYNPAGSGSVIYVLVKNLNEAALPTDALTVHLEGANPITEGTIGLDLPLGPAPPPTSNTPSTPPPARSPTPALPLETSSTRGILPTCSRALVRESGGQDVLTQVHRRHRPQATHSASHRVCCCVFCQATV